MLACPGSPSTGGSNTLAARACSPIILSFFSLTRFPLTRYLNDIYGFFPYLSLRYRCCKPAGLGHDRSTADRLNSLGRVGIPIVFHILSYNLLEPTTLEQTYHQTITSKKLNQPQSLSQRARRWWTRMDGKQDC